MSAITLTPQELDSIALLVWETRERLHRSDMRMVHDWALECYVSGTVDAGFVQYLINTGRISGR